MPRFIIKLTDKHNDYFLDWSTIVDAPITYGMDEEEFLKYHLEEYGKNESQDAPQRIKRAKETGTSSLCYTLDELIDFNRAGPNETNLTYDELVEKYCAKKE
jgi:hypothetical protein